MPTKNKTEKQIVAGNKFIHVTIKSAENTFGRISLNIDRIVSIQGDLKSVWCHIQMVNHPYDRQYIVMEPYKEVYYKMFGEWPSDPITNDISATNLTGTK